MKEKELFDQLVNYFKNNHYLGISDFTKIIPREYLTEFLINVGDNWELSSRLNKEFFLYIKDKVTLTDEIVNKFLRKSVDFIGDLLDGSFYQTPNPVLIRHYAKFKQVLPSDYYEKALRSNDPAVLASLIEYNPSLQYNFTPDKVALAKIELPVLDAMYWWEKLKGTYWQEFLFLEPDRWMVSFGNHSVYYRKEMVRERWDVPFQLFTKRPKTLLYKYAKELIQNPFTPSTIILLIKPKYPNLKVPTFPVVPLNQKLKMLRKWEEKSLETFYEKVYKVYNPV